MATKTPHNQAAESAQLSQVAAIPTDGFSVWPRVKIFIGNRSREWVRLQEKAGRFPRRVYLTQRSVVWPNQELRRWAENPAGYSAARVEQEAA